MSFHSWDKALIDRLYKVALPLKHDAYPGPFVFLKI